MEIGEEKKAGCDTSTIYVGDLSTRTLESDLFRLFSSIGKVSSIKLVKRVEPHSSYAFVVFESGGDAKKAIREYNYYELHGKQMRLLNIMKKENKPPADGNIFVKNLPEDISSKDLENTFSVFGRITSCKVATTASGKSKRYGYIQFEDKRFAEKAMRNCAGGAMLNESKIIVEGYNPEAKKKSSTKDKTLATFTNCFVKNFPVSVQKEELLHILEGYGVVTSLFFPVNEDGKSKGFALANFESHEFALSAINGLHGTHPFHTADEDDGKSAIEPFYIQRGQKKEERIEELRRMFEQMSMQGQNYKKNLYVTNIPGGFGVDELMKIFEEFGKVVSISVDVDSGNPQKKYAYVCYSTPEEATIAVERGNEVYLNEDRLHVSYFKNKFERIKEKELDGATYRPIAPYMYSHSICHVSDRRRYGEDVSPHDKQLFGGDNINRRLYEIVLARAALFKSRWEELKVCDEAGFSKKITKILRSKPDKEMRRIVEEGDQAINETVASVVQVLCGDDDQNTNIKE